MNKKSYRAKKADSKWDYTSDQEEAAGIRARQQRERGYGLPGSRNVDELTRFDSMKDRCSIAKHNLDSIIEYFDKNRERITPDFLQKLVDGRDVCVWLMKVSKGR